jgi:hypothetical protein
MHAGFGRTFGSAQFLTPAGDAGGAAIGGPFFFAVAAHPADKREGRTFDAILGQQGAGGLDDFAIRRGGNFTAGPGFRILSGQSQQKGGGICAAVQNEHRGGNFPDIHIESHETAPEK